MKFLVLLSLLTAVSAAPTTLEARQDGSTRNELSGACKAVTVLFARGTTEAGNVGSLAGPPFFSALQALGLDIAVQGTNNYPADIAGFLAGGSATGAAQMANDVSTAKTKCPNTKIVLSGYSQGAQVTHKAANQLSSTLKAAVNAIVLFGDPDKGQAISGISSSKILTVCHSGDLICEGQSIILTPHLTYGNDAGTAAKFVQGKL